MVDNSSGGGLAPGLSDTQQMMFAFGDFRRPNPESASIVEQVVLAQLRSILHLATAVAAQRNSKILIIEDILYLMRKSPVKIQRLVKYLKAKDKVFEMSLLEKGEANTDKRMSNTKRCRNYLEVIDETGVILSACDQEYNDQLYHERLVRFDKMSKNMDERKYMEFCKARSVSFRGKYSQWFQAALQEVVDNLAAPDARSRSLLRPSPAAVSPRRSALPSPLTGSSRCGRGGMCCVWGRARIRARVRSV